MKTAIRRLDLPQHSSPRLLLSLLLLSIIFATQVQAFTNSDDDYWQPNTALSGTSLIVDALVMDG